jgi:hypothetical protein
MLSGFRTLAFTLCAILVVGCDRFSDAKLVGTWRCEDEDSVEELALKPDHSFRSLNTFKKELVTPSPMEETGTWHVRDNQVTLDSILTWNKERSRINRTLLQLKKDSLLTKNFDGTKTLTYRRLELPVCVGSPASTKEVHEAKLIGSWQVHYNTHDYQFHFMPGNRYSLLGLISGKWDLLLEGRWHIDGSSLSVKPENTPYGPADDPEQKWTVAAVGNDCFTIRDPSSWEYTLQRLK